MPEPVLLFTTTSDPAGAERIVAELAKRLDRARFLPVAVALDGRGSVWEELRQAGVEAVDLECYHKLLFPLAVERLARLCRERQVRLIHTHLIHATVVGRLVARRLAVPTVSTCHIAERRWRPWHYWLDRVTAGAARCEVCVSETVRQHQLMKTGLPESFFRVITNGIELQRFACLPARQEARHRLGLPPDRPVVGFFGRLNHQKGPDLFLRAAHALQAGTDATATYAIAGYGREEEHLRNQARRLGLQEIQFVGRRDATEFLPALDILAMPSRWEGMPLVAIEALAAGVALVASDISPLREVAQSEREALLVQAENSEALAAGIARVLGDPDLGQQLAQNGIRRAQEFSVERMVQAYERLYEEVLA